MGRASYVEHRQVVVPLLHGVVDGIDEARIVLAALRDVVGARAGGGGRVVAHDLRDELRGLVAAVVERRVRVRVCLHDEANVCRQRRKLRPIVAVPVVGERGHHLAQLLGQHIAPLVALRRLRLRGRRRVPEREIVRRRGAPVAHHRGVGTRGAGKCVVLYWCFTKGSVGEPATSGRAAEVLTEKKKALAKLRAKSSCRFATSIATAWESGDAR
jgi:hypothetical protein